jgi:hypothetical protein
MVSLPKIMLFVLLAVFAWYATRWLNKPSEKVLRRRPAASNAPQGAIEDLYLCNRCGTHIAAGTPNCGKAGCPQPR